MDSHDRTASATAAQDARPPSRGEQAAAWLSWCVVVIAALSLFGWLIPAPRLLRPHEAFGAVRPWSALAWCLAGTGMLLQLRRRYRSARALAIVGLCIAVAGGLAAALGRPLPFDAELAARVPALSSRAPAYGIAVTIALMFVGVFASLLLLSRLRVRPAQSGIAGGIAAVVLSLAIALALVQMAGLLEESATRMRLETSMQGLACAMLLGVTLFQRVGRYELRSMAPPAWAPLLAAITGLLVMPVIWYELRARDATGDGTLPDLVLALGLAVTALLATTLWLARRIWQQASLEGMARMQRAIERATDGVWELDVPARRTYRSASLLRHLGYDPATLNGPIDRWRALIHPDDAGRVAEALDHHLSGRTRAFEAEYRVRAADGRWHALVERGRVIERTPQREPARLLGITADVTDRARAEAALEASEQRFRAIFDSAQQLQLLVDLDGTVLEANRAAVELAGADVPLPGMTLWEAPWWDDAGRAKARERFTRACGGETSRFEAVFVARPDRRATFDVGVMPIAGGEGQIMQVLVEGRDLTDRKRAEVSMREIGALSTMGQIAARVAHEINNPLAGIQNAFLLIRGAIPTEHPHYHFVGAIEREIARIAAVTRQLYETYRPDQSMASESSVILAVGDAVSFLEQVNRARDVRITTDISRAPSLVPVPDALIRQTLYNLVQNAVDASPEHGTVTVSAVQEGDECVIRVLDEGPGIPAEIRARIFEPFFSTKDRTVKTGGMGIGLALVRQSVSAVGGRIAVRDRPGGGTEFEVRLPLTPMDTGVL